MPESEPTSAEAWFRDRLPADWSAGGGELEVAEDADEMLVLVPRVEAGREAAARFRAESRDKRMEIAREAERRFGRKVSWGVRAGDEVHLFTTLSLPVMTRLRLPERQVLDTLIAAGVARSRSDALAWCVRLVGQHQSDWLAELRGALEAVEKAREKGPKA